MTKTMIKSRRVNAQVQRVWDAWTTAEGLQFISNKSNVDLRTGGPYEWFLDLPPDENGKRGGEGAKVLAWLPYRVLAFSWTFPPAVPALRNADATYQVVVLFEPVGENETQIELNAHGWLEGPDWDAGWDYFDDAWDLVLDRLVAHFA